MRRIYDWLGEPLTPEAERAMRQWTSENARGKRPPHEYALEDFGYSESALAQAFAPYRRRHLSKQESAQE